MWSGVRMMFLLSIFPARDRKILYARPRRSCLVDSFEGWCTRSSMSVMICLYSGSGMSIVLTKAKRSSQSISLDSEFTFLMSWRVTAWTISSLR